MLHGKLLQYQLVLTGVIFILNAPDAPNSATHNSWLQEKIEDGWVYGPIKDATAKTHPCIVPYEQLPPEQQKKDALFSAIVNALR